MADVPCLHCSIMSTIDQWFEENGQRQNGQVIVDVAQAISKLQECAAELAAMAEDRSKRRRAIWFAHEALDAAVTARRTGVSVAIEIPAEH